MTAYTNFPYFSQLNPQPVTTRKSRSFKKDHYPWFGVIFTFNLFEKCLFLLSLDKENRTKKGILSLCFVCECCLEHPGIYLYFNVYILLQISLKEIKIWLYDIF